MSLQKNRRSDNSFSITCNTSTKKSENITLPFQTRNQRNRIGCDGSGVGYERRCTDNRSGYRLRQHHHRGQFDGFPLTERIAERSKRTATAVRSISRYRQFGRNQSVLCRRVSTLPTPVAKSCRRNARFAAATTAIQLNLRSVQTPIAVVVNPANTFADNLSLEELGTLFTTADSLVRCRR